MSSNEVVIAITLTILLTSVIAFGGLSTPESAQFANFAQTVDNVYTATMNAFADLKVEHAIAGEYRTNEQIYYEIATGIDPGENGTLMGANVNKIGNDNKNCQRLNPDVSQKTLGMTLPNIRETNIAWYTTSDGQIFNATGYTYDGKTYFNASCYKEGELPASKTNTQEKLAEKIADTLLKYEKIVK